MTAQDFSVGQRVQTHPATDAWMRGLRYGTVTITTKSYVYVRLDHTRRVVRFKPHNLLPLEG